MDKPLPTPTPATQPFFDGAARGVLMVQRCQACGTYFAPGRPRCEECLGDLLHWHEAAGTGTVFSYAIVHRPFHPAFADAVPYNVALVQLTEGPRLITTIIGTDHIDVGMPVRAVFDQPLNLPKFTPT